MKKIKKILAANRSEIAIRIFRASEESGIRTVAIYSKEDRFALHRFKTDESYLVGKDKGPIQAYLDTESIINIAKMAGVDAVHPGYGFLSENPEFAKACIDNGIEFIGPTYEILEKLGNKTEAKKIAESANIPIIKSIAIPNKFDVNSLQTAVKDIGYPLIIKASWGGGGRGMRVVKNEAQLIDQIEIAKSESIKTFGKDEVFIEQYLEDACHIEVQILGDKHNNIVHLYERDCSIQRRHQKIIERAPASFLENDLRNAICDSAVAIAKKVNYVGAGTVEFLLDKKTNQFYFIEVNPRIQVEHTVTEEVTGIDIVKAQIKIAEGHKIGDDVSLPNQKDISLDGHAIQCRITTEDPLNNFMPDYGKIVTYRSASGFGIRLDGATATSGSVVTPYYDSMLVKVTSWANNVEECRKRMDRALREFRIRGVKTNLVFLESLINHPSFIQNKYSTNFVDNEKSLYIFKPKKDRASKLISLLGDIVVNGNKELPANKYPETIKEIEFPESNLTVTKKNYVKLLKEEGPLNFSKIIRKSKNILITDTTMRDAHQSLLATRMRTVDLSNIANYYSNNLSELFSIECWGGATFDVSMRFLKEDPWDRLYQLNKLAPNLMKQMLFRGSNAVGYTNYPDNVVKYFIKESARSGIDIFRVFDSLNLTDNMKIAIEEINKEEKLCEGAICYTNDLNDKNEQKYTLKYYLELVKELERIGVHVIAIKDMAGLCKPDAIETLIKGIRDVTELPIHFHTHDTSGLSSSSVITAIKNNVDIVDLAMDSMSGLTSQPSMGSVVSSTKTYSNKPLLEESFIRSASLYWEEVRKKYLAFESDFKGGTSEVYFHQMPGGQFTNLKDQARNMGINNNKWDKVSQTYALVNKMFGDIIKVTPSSKVVGDMTLFMIANDLSEEDVLNPEKEISFPESVKSFFKGELGIPLGGFPKNLQKKILGNEKQITARPGSIIPPVDIDKVRSKLEKITESKISNKQLASYLMYPKVFLDFFEFQKKYSDPSILPTELFFYGPQIDQEYSLSIEKGKSLILRYLAKGEINKNGNCSVFFEVNGQPRTIEIFDEKFDSAIKKATKADEKNSNEIGSPLPGQISQIFVKNEDKVIKGDKLVVIEAMKMETTISAEKTGKISNMQVQIGSNVESKDLLFEIID
tara:strand:- start:321 stop:3767 length:3447 start_codon:yes stop_codon:yes gene_type:complete